MLKWFKKIFAKKGESNVKAILSKLLNGEELSAEEKAEALKYVGENSEDQPDEEGATEEPEGNPQEDEQTEKPSTEDPSTEDPSKEDPNAQTEEPKNNEQPADDPAPEEPNPEAPNSEEPVLEVPAVNPNAPNPGQDEQFSRLGEMLNRLELKFDDTVNALRKEVEDVRMLVVDQTKKPQEVTPTPDAPQFKKGFFDF